MASNVAVVNTLSRSSNTSRPFNGCTITFSHLSSLKEKGELKNKVKQLGGKCHRGLTGIVTHIVTMDWTTPKSLHARIHKKPILMMPKWIEAVAKQSGNEILPAIHPSFLIHRLPIFHGFTLCFSQVSLEKRAMLRQKVERNGGKYSGDFNPSVVTHLILCAPEGKKYDIALKFDSVKKVNALWFTDSLKHGIPLPEEDYPAKKLEVTNSQNTSKRKSGDSFPNMSDFLSCKKNKSNLFNNVFNNSTTKRQIKELDITPEKRILDMSLEKADGFDSILKDLGNLGKQNGRHSTASLQPRLNSSQIEKRPQKLTLKKIQSSQLSDKITDSLPVLWEASA